MKMGRSSLGQIYPLIKLEIEIGQVQQLLKNHRDLGNQNTTKVQLFFPKWAVGQKRTPIHSDAPNIKRGLYNEKTSEYTNGLHRLTLIIMENDHVNLNSFIKSIKMVVKIIHLKKSLCLFRLITVGLYPVIIDLGPYEKLALLLVLLPFGPG